MRAGGPWVTVRCAGAELDDNAGGAGAVCALWGTAAQAVITAAASPVPTSA